ncbi:DUF2868 domain-containing protein [Alkalilimnicola sp. S0819]|uniref:DUF2868 domain-containing protein n=1 Tax=Alkalilimnicola sp. S0819 TaxID=2613922 RepID=UPI00126152A5|nr:DUF2868 domain-containing protein [Alkalilimnicola sp. S0819]KAB7619675.1 DUF2868 domain-containing protein [Alkalilimnicola sp. S0819]MPQ17531.1 DUF2868 domain-containing protein [Alkalilimnicola sp. S0819]
MSTRATAPTRLEQLWLAEAVRLTEAHAGLLDDGEANRRARAAGGDLQARILCRAQVLGERDGLLAALRQWRQGSALALLLLLAFAVFSGATLAFAALGDGGYPVNVFWALGSLLGLNLVNLLLWFASLHGGGGAGVLGGLWLRASAWLAREGRAAHLGPALASLLGRAGLARWGFGLLVQGFWCLLLLSALFSLLLLFSARSYTFTWETTLLSVEDFIVFTRVVGSLPSWLGFPLPDAEAVRSIGAGGGAGEAARQAWAGWLLGALFCFGFMPRLLLLMICYWPWRRGLARLGLDLSLPEYRLLRDRLDSGSTRLGVSDPAPAWAASRPAIDAGPAGEGAVMLAVELGTDLPWPPTPSAAALDAGRADSRSQRRALLEAFARHPPARLLIACDPRRSVDRGTLGFIAELARSAQASRVWLLTRPADTSPGRRQEWLEALQALGLEVAEALPMDWLGAAHD